MKEPVIISYSGGLDSTCLAMKYLATDHPVVAVSFKYGQNHAIELRKAKQCIAYLKKRGMPIEHKIVDLSSAFEMSQSSLCGTGDIPKGEYNSEDMKSTVVENRNVIFSAIVYGMALSLSKQTNQDVIISLGVHDGDHDLYPDCRLESIRAAQELYRISNWGSERIHFETPFVECTKSEVLRQGVQAMKDAGMNKRAISGVLSRTSSCYSPGPDGQPCGSCGTCVERAQAFADNLMEDPAIKVQ